MYRSASEIIWSQTHKFFHRLACHLAMHCMFPNVIHPSHIKLSKQNKNLVNAFVSYWFKKSITYQSRAQSNSNDCSKFLHNIPRWWMDKCLQNPMSVINRPILKIHHECDGEQSEYKHDQFAIISHWLLAALLLVGCLWLNSLIGSQIWFQHFSFFSSLQIRKSKKSDSKLWVNSQISGAQQEKMSAKQITKSLLH